MCFLLHNAGQKLEYKLILKDEIWSSAAFIERLQFLIHFFLRVSTRIFHGLSFFVLISGITKGGMRGLEPHVLRPVDS